VPRFAQPVAPPPAAGHEPLRIEIHLDRCRLTVVLLLLGSASLALRQPLLRLPQRLLAPLRRAQLLGQLIPTSLAIQLVLQAVDLG
jgi:hypothetical protein